MEAVQLPGHATAEAATSEMGIQWEGTERDVGFRLCLRRRILGEDGLTVPARERFRSYLL